MLPYVNRIQMTWTSGHMDFFKEQATALDLELVLIWSLVKFL